ncbi:MULTISPECIES: TIGR03085 family metal-binding protein [Gordonia]|uniref:TIGR03085 family metal-binding protein n=1 Tax=Gordonia TaxID=2053 RepID=UPI0010F712FA|nr:MULTISPECIES: TIGR03085 family metal-binding protein [unclassified Gordonia (in: high G+C Gram-positive bacteria)]MCX2752431.1 TIGR03085 family metal-binding protein [Gordonia sp. 4N]
MTGAQKERAALVETLRKVGPDAPTLCEGWTTRDLLAHLVVRERRPDTGPGILIPAFAGHTEKVRTQATSKDWDAQLALLASGPPVYSPFKLIDRFANLAEMFVHHEDVLRGGADPDGPWTPRSLAPELEAELRTPAKSMGRMTLKKVPARVTLRTPDGEDLVTAGSGDDVIVTGRVGELVLFAFGRTPVDVTFAGDAAAITGVRESSRGL